MKINTIPIEKGMSNHPYYNVWRGMLHRCYSSNHKNYKWYGARGITVCDRWFDFSLFIQDIGIRTNGFCLDRIDNDRNYEPSNCKWVSPRDNNPLTKGIVFDNPIGKRFGKWTIVHGIPKKRIRSKRFFCKCDCGQTRVILSAFIFNGSNTACLNCKDRKVE